MNEIKLRAMGKINLNLLITGKRDNGYHDIKSVFQVIDLADEITIRKNIKFKLITNSNVLNSDIEKNIIYKAYNYMKTLYPTIGGVTVVLTKVIPMEAGLGGGSADCAAFLMGLNKLYDLKISMAKLEKIGAKLGADVVPLMHRGAYVVTGIGDELEKINAKARYNVVIIKPDFSSSTKEMYKEYDNNKELVQVDNTDKIVKFLETGDFSLLPGSLYNVFEEVNPDRDKILEIKKELKESGAVEALMSGSGSSIYGIYDNLGDAIRTHLKLSKKYKSYFCQAFFG